MTYGEPLWVSAYTYRGLLKACGAGREEEEAGESAKGPEGKPYLHVIGTYDLTKGAPKGRLAYVFPGRIESLAPAGRRGVGWS